MKLLHNFEVKPRDFLRRYHSYSSAIKYALVFHLILISNICISHIMDLVHIRTVFPVLQEGVLGMQTTCTYVACRGSAPHSWGDKAAFKGNVLKYCLLRLSVYSKALTPCG